MINTEEESRAEERENSPKSVLLKTRSPNAFGCYDPSWRTPRFFYRSLKEGGSMQTEREGNRKRAALSLLRSGSLSKTQERQWPDMRHARAEKPSRAKTNPSLHRVHAWKITANFPFFAVLHGLERLFEYIEKGIDNIIN